MGHFCSFLRCARRYVVVNSSHTPIGYVTYSKLHQMVSKDLFLRVHHITSYWRVLVLDWIRQLLRNHAPFDVRRRLQWTITIDKDAAHNGIYNFVRWLSVPWTLNSPSRWMRQDGFLSDG